MSKLHMRKRLHSLKRFLTLKYFFWSLSSIVVIFILFIAVSIGSVALWVKADPISAKLEREKENTKNNIVTDVTELYPVKVLGIVVPHSIEDIVREVKAHDHVSIGGGRNSMGGETASPRAVQLDMREYTKILDFSTTTKEITVQSGIRWRDIQDYIDPYDLSVKIMQTYSNFTVGGSLSVNVHGRYIGLGPIILSVKKFTIVLADGSVVTASPSLHSDIFYSAIGGMGGIGVISDVTLSLADNVNVERSQIRLPTGTYWQYFKDHVRSNPNVIFHNGDMYPPDFANVSAVSWEKTDKAPTVSDRLIPRRQDYWKERIAWVVMSEWPKGRWIREHIVDPLLYSGEAPVHPRNYEASYDIAELEPKSRGKTSYILQEYFVPVERFDEWVPKMKKIFNDHDVNVINVSIRHALPDLGAKLAWARTESFAFVVYYKQGTDDASRREVANWTREMIDQVILVGGAYYLPYQPHATDEQFHRAYPHAIEYFEIKKAYDPTDKFTNTLWDKYYSEEKLDYYKQKKTIRTIASTTREYVRPFDNAYLSIPEWYIVYAADEYAHVLAGGMPSQFDYSRANQEYWKELDYVTALTASSTNNNDDYKTVLSVIGWSFSVENIIKGLYENTIGRISEWCAGHTQVPEDRYAAKVAQEYATLIYDLPWYDFTYADSLKGLWHVHADSELSVGQNIRRAERRIFLSLEYSIKAVYASAIAYATHSKFGVQDDVIFAIVSEDGGKTEELLSAPHYQPFTRMLLDRMKRESASSSFRILEISGNDKITFAYLDDVGAPVVASTNMVARDTEVVAVSGSQVIYKDRITVLANVGDLFAIYRTLAQRGIAIEHFYDY